MWSMQYGNSTTKWPFYTFFLVNSPLIYILFSMFEWLHMAHDGSKDILSLLPWTWYFYRLFNDWAKKGSSVQLQGILNIKKQTVWIWKIRPVCIVMLYWIVSMSFFSIKFLNFVEMIKFEIRTKMLELRTKMTEIA